MSFMIIGGAPPLVPGEKFQILQYAPALFPAILSNILPSSHVGETRDGQVFNEWNPRAFASIIDLFTDFVRETVEP
jgi:hypothetical protein